MLRRVFVGIAVTGVLLVAAGCGERDSKEVSGTDPDLDRAFGSSVLELQRNKLDNLPGVVYESQVSSAIHWQPWTKDTLKKANQANRLVLAVVAAPQQPDYLQVLKDLEADSERVDLINQTYVPVLIDAGTIREWALLSSELCMEIRAGLQLPLMVWMTPQAQPVAWLPLSASSSDTIAGLFDQSHVMVTRVWEDDREYVAENSKVDQVNRAKRMLGRYQERSLSVDPASDGPRALRQLTSLYDPVSRTFDETGGLFPCSAIDLLALGARTEGLPESLRERSENVLSNLLDDLLSSPMFDPLDGGVFWARRGSTWLLPGFYRDSSTQSRVAISLLNAGASIGDQRAIDRALGIIEFLEREYATPDGTFSLGRETTAVTEDWLWRMEDVTKILSADELEVWVPATGMTERGNLPSEVDPQRQFFRANSIGFVKSAAELSDASGRAAGEIQDLLDSARRKLLKVRDERVQHSGMSRHGHAAATFRAASAYACAYRVTGDEKFLQKAETTLTKARAAFSKGPRLVMYDSDLAPSLIAGRALLYGVAMNASLDLWAITLDEKWVFWADDLATTAAELFVADAYLSETPAQATLMDLPISDLAMLFEESSVGMLSLSSVRLKALGHSVLPALEAELFKFPMQAIDNPILHTDLVRSAIVNDYGTTYVYGSSIPEEVKSSLVRAPLDSVTRKPADGDLAAGIEMKPGKLLKIDREGKMKSVDQVTTPSVPSLRKP